MLSVDGTDFLMAVSYKKALYSFKFKKMGLRYEVGMCIKTGDIAWWHGPFAPGLYNDDMVFKNALIKSLKKGERVKIDTGYLQVVCPSGHCAKLHTAQPSVHGGKGSTAA